MPDPTNTEIAAALDELGDLSELDGAIIHRIVAYRNAAKAVREAPVSVTALARQGRASELPGIGATIQEKVLALADDGAIPAAVKLRAKFPPGLIEITRLPGLGPKRARRLFDEHVQWYRMYGMSMRPVPKTWENFQEYWERKCSEELEINKATLDIFRIRIPKPWFVLMPTAVCCRSADYQAQATRVQLYNAVIVQPLTPQQVDAYLLSAGQQASGLREALQRKSALGAQALQVLPHHGREIGPLLGGRLGTSGLLRFRGTGHVRDL